MPERTRTQSWTIGGRRLKRLWPVMAASVFAGGVVNTGSAQAAPLEPKVAVCATAVGEPGDVAVVNVTPVEADGPGFGAVRASDAPSNNTLGVQAVSNVNFWVGTVDPNVAFARIGADNRICFDNSEHASIQLVMDQMGTMPAENFTLASTTGAKRLIDTRRGFIDGEPELALISYEGTDKWVRPDYLSFRCFYFSVKFQDGSSGWGRRDEITISPPTDFLVPDYAAGTLPDNHPMPTNTTVYNLVWNYRSSISTIYAENGFQLPQVFPNQYASDTSLTIKHVIYFTDAKKSMALGRDNQLRVDHKIPMQIGDSFGSRSESATYQVNAECKPE